MNIQTSEQVQICSENRWILESNNREGIIENMTSAYVDILFYELEECFRE